MSEPIKIKFKASLHHTRAAISVFGHGDVGLSLSVDESQLPEIIKLVILKDTIFEVNIVGSPNTNGLLNHGSNVSGRILSPQTIEA